MRLREPTAEHGADRRFTACEQALLLHGKVGLRRVTDQPHQRIVADRLGQLYEAKGNREKAAHYYAKFVDLWKDADPELQPRVAEAKARLARLGGERNTKP
jgi:hypothetical protein